MTPHALFLPPAPALGYVIMTAPGSTTPSRLIIGATHLDAVLILERAVRLGIETDDDPRRIVPMTPQQYTAATGRTMHPVAMTTTEQRRRATGRARTA